MNVSRFKKKLDISFTNHDLLRQAFTHSSYVNEHRKKQFTDNERLEFLGDAVLELGISQYLYRHHPQMPEGEMTKLRAAIVCEESLVDFAQDLEFGDYILLGKGEEQTGGRTRPALLADVFESFLGALYLDQGYDQVLLFLEDHILDRKSTRLNSSHVAISYAVCCLKQKNFGDGSGYWIKRSLKKLGYASAVVNHDSAIMPSKKNDNSYDHCGHQFEDERSNGFFLEL